MIKYPYSILERKIEKTDVTILGVQHTAEDFEKYKDFFQEQVSFHEAIILEQPAGENYFNDFRGSDFFDSFAEFARMQGKRVYLTDPARMPEFRLYERQIEKGAFAACLNSAVAFVGLNLDSDFLSIAGIIGQMLSLSIISGSEEWSKIRSINGWFGALSWGYHDYREIKLTAGIRKICKRGDEKTLLAVHGEGHSKGISFYLTYPYLARLKLLTYPSYEKRARNAGLSTTREFIPLTNEEAYSLYTHDLEKDLEMSLVLTPEDYKWKLHIL